MPQYFKQQGYETAGIGKIYDPRCVDNDLDRPSWSIPFYKESNDYYSSETGRPAAFYQSPETKELVRKYRAEGEKKGLTGSALWRYSIEKIKPSVECVDVPDNAYADGANALHAIDIMDQLSKSNKPFFLAVGFHRPHLPFVAPKKYWDLYKRDDMPVAAFQKKAKNSPDLAYHHAGELYSYTDIPPLASFSDQMVGLDLPLDKQKELIHGYYAAASYTDALVGRILDALDSLGLSDNTIIVLWGDHGWHLGDHNLWCKHTNFEQATHAPLIISAPGYKPAATSSLSEFTDVFPTLCDLAGLTIPQQLDGKSLVPVLKDPHASVHEYAMSQYPRFRKITEDDGSEKAAHLMGYSLRTGKYRYTVWLKNNFRSYDRYSKDLVVARELYDYSVDPEETENVVDNENYAAIVDALNDKMVNYFADQYHNLNAENWYVSPGGVDMTTNNNGLNPSNPLQTISYAVNSAWSPGDTIFVMEGVYKNPGFGTGDINNGPVVQLNTTGQSTGWLVIRNYPGQKPKIKFDGAGGFVSGNQTYLEISGFEIEGPNQSITK